MALPNTYTKKWGGFDLRYWLTLALIVIVAIAVGGFKKRYLYSCPTHTIPAQGIYTKGGLVQQSFLINEPILFTTPDVRHQNAEWLVDGQIKTKGDRLQYTFTAAGKYIVTLQLDGKCSYTRVVNVLPYKHETTNLQSGDPTALPDVVIEGNETFEAGTITYFTTPVVANSYEWQILEMPEYGTKTEQLVGYSIISAGNYTLQLKLNNNTKTVFTKSIKVTPPKMVSSTNDYSMEVPKPLDMPTQAPPAKENKETGNALEDAAASEPKKPKNILPDSEILSMLQLIRKDKKTTSDLAASLCNGEKTKVLANDDKVMTLGELCSKLQSKSWALGKRPKVTSVRTLRDESDGNCISVIYVQYK